MEVTGRAGLWTWQRGVAVVGALALAATLPAGLATPARAEDPLLLAAPDTASVTRGSAVEVDVLANDSGPGGTPLLDPLVEITIAPMHGQAEVLDADGPGGQSPTLSYEPDLDAPTQDTLEYRLSDGGLTATAQVTLTVANAAPVAAADVTSVTSAAGQTVLVDVLANDSDPDRGTLKVLSLTQPAHGTAVVESGRIRYDPVDDYVGPDSFTYTITDGQGGQATADVTVSVLDATTPMTLLPDVITATAGSPVEVPVLANDASGGRDPLTIIGASQPASRGTVVVSADGRSLTYTAPPTFVGDDSFTYTVIDRRGNTATGQVSATVSAPAAVPAVTTTVPTTMDVGRRYRIPVGVTGFDATGAAAHLQRETSTGWATVASGALGQSGGEVAVTPNTKLAGLGPSRASGRARLRVLVEPPSGAALVTATTSATIRARVRITVSGPLTRADVPYSYRPGCPVRPSALRRISLNYWDYAGRLKRGTLIARADVVRDLSHVFTRAFTGGFQIKKIRPVDVYYREGRRSPTASDKAAMRAGNTSAFNCRPVVGNPTKRSNHSYGVAIDINTFENPYVVGGGFYPRRAGTYLRRSPCRTGMICPDGVLARAMRERGWPWGARWSRPDYQHFSANGG